MKSELKSFSLRGGLVLALTVLLYNGALAQGGSRADNNDEDSAPANDIDAQTGKILSEAIEFLNMDQFEEARERLADLRVDRLSPYEKSRLHQLLFNLEMNDEDYPGAREQLQLSIDSGGLNAQEISALRYQMAQLFVQEEKYAEAAAALEAWIAAEPMPNSAAYYLLAASYYYQEDFDRALPNSLKAVELAGDAPQEAWLSMYASLLIQKEDYAAAIPVLKRMVNMFPDKKNYWQQLSGLYTQQEDYDNALIVMEFAHYGGMLTEGRELSSLADLYSVLELPYRAGTMLEAAIADGKLEKSQQNLEKLGNAWMNAREFEKAVPVFKTAAGVAEDGELYKRAGEIQQQLMDWEGSVESFEEAIEKGGLRDEAYVEYLLGFSLNELDRIEDAKVHLQRAARDPEHRSSAQSLIDFINATN